MKHSTTRSMANRPRDEDLRDQHKALNSEEELEVGLEDSMDASDPPSATAPGHDGYPGPLPGTEEERKADKKAKNKAKNKE